MLLKDKYYKLLKENKLDSNNAVYLLSLYPQADVYRGHFPHKPVCPGACNIETIRECAEMLTGKDLDIKAIKQCRLTAVASPQICPLLDVIVSVARIEGTSSYNVVAKICDKETTYMEFKGELRIKVKVAQ